MPAEDTRHPERQLNCLQKEVGQNIEDKETKELGTEIRPGEGVIKEKFPNTRKPYNWQVCGSFGISEGNITGRINK